MWTNYITQFLYSYRLYEEVNDAKVFLLRHASYVNEQKTLDFVKAGTSAFAARLRTSVHRHRTEHIHLHNSAVF